MSKKTINITLEKKINDILEAKKINKSKLTNYLISIFFENGGNIKDFKK